MGYTSKLSFSSSKSNLIVICSERERGRNGEGEKGRRGEEGRGGEKIQLFDAKREKSNHEVGHIWFLFNI